MPGKTKTRKKFDIPTKIEKVIFQQLSEKDEPKADHDPSVNTRFKPGNKASKGRPSGSRNKVSLYVEHLLEDDVDHIVAMLLEKARDGDMNAIKLIIERICPVRKDRPINLTMKKVVGVPDTIDAMAVIVNAAAQGEITPSEASSMASVIEVYRKTVETVDINARLNDIQGQMKTLGI